MKLNADIINSIAVFGDQYPDFNRYGGHVYHVEYVPEHHYWHAICTKIMFDPDEFPMDVFLETFGETPCTALSQLANLIQAELDCLVVIPL